MPSRTPPVAQIFEDPDDALKSKKMMHKRVHSVGDILKGRKMKESAGEDLKSNSVVQDGALQERHLNSPPQIQRVPLKDGKSQQSRHKKTNSAVSLKSFMKSKEKNSDCDSLNSSDGHDHSRKPKKTKSSTNLSGLLRKRSRREMKSETEITSPAKENIPPSISPSSSHTPIWAQFATQPIVGVDGNVQYPNSKHEPFQPLVDSNKSTFTAGTGLHNDLHEANEIFQRPVRPQLEHRASRSSAFKENIENEGDTCAPRNDGNKPRRPDLAHPTPAHSVERSVDLYQTPLGSKTEPKQKRESKVLDIVSTLNLRAKKGTSATSTLSTPAELPLTPQELDSAFENVLDSLNIPHNMRDNMRNLKQEVKMGLIKGERGASGSAIAHPIDNDELRPSARSIDRERAKTHGDDGKDRKSSRSRSRPRSRILTLTKRDDGSPAKKDRGEGSTRSASKSRPRSIDLTTASGTLNHSNSTTCLATPDSTTTPGDFIHYLREVQKPELVEVGKLHKLRLLLRNESVTWTDAFVKKGGIDELVQLLHRIIKVEWREEHEDALLHENLLCLKALCTTSLALQQLAAMEDDFFPALLGMLFDEERRGPSEFATRSIIPSLLFTHLSAAREDSAAQLHSRATKILSFLRDPIPEEANQPHGFISQMHISRPYKIWCREVVNVTKEVFWIFLHHTNVVPILDSFAADGGPGGFAGTYFAAPRPPHPAAPYVGGVEWEATQYLSTHLDLLNGLIASIPTKAQRNQLREDLRQSGWEKVMGGSLRTCKEKFYGSVHDGLKLWVAAAKADGWPVEDVREGPPRDIGSPKKSPRKKAKDDAPKLDLDVGGAGPMAQIEDVWR